VAFEKIVEGDPPRSLLHDPEFLTQQRIVFPKGDADDFSKRLKPFGLVFEMKELGGWSFDLNENFQVERIKKKTEGDDRGLWLGDKIIAINGQRILRPVDLVKCRSAMRPGDEITLLIERSGETQKVKQRVTGETFVKLEANRLSDLDKQEKLEAFWSREFDQ
jgi:predicted metalloprotease with PDZ domain